MSTKQRLAEAIAALPDTLTVEEAVERLYRAFKLKQAHTEAADRKKEALTALFGSLLDDPLERPEQGMFEAREPMS